MKILQVVPSYSPSWGGPSKVVHDLTKQLSSRGLDVDILTTCSDGELLYPVQNGVNLIAFKRNYLSKLWTGFSWEIYGFLRESIKEYDLIHIHELWHYPHLMSSRFALNNNIPYLIAVHGELEDWCLGHKRFKKQLYSLSIQKNLLRKARNIHALTSNEKLSINKYLNNELEDIITIPNGINLVEFSSLPHRGGFKRQYAQLIDGNYILFMGRINIKKGLDILIEAFKCLANEYKELYLVIAGPDNEGYAQELRELLKYTKLANKTIFTGMLTGEDKLQAFVDAELLVLPSYSEGFPIVLIEAMACGVPVVMSNKAGISREVELNKAGVIVETNPESLYKGIKNLLDHEELRKKVAENGKRFVKNNYDIEKITDKLIEVYEQIANKNLGAN